MEEYTFILTIASIVVPVCATILTSVYTVVNRVKAEHKPYVILDSIEEIKALDKCFYFIVMLSNKIRKKCSDKDINDFINTDSQIDVKIRLKNIGYGVATNIKFYDLNTGFKIAGTQSLNDYMNQKMFTTFDIAQTETKSVQTSIITKKVDGAFMEDDMRILCVYQDLNGNIYDFVFVINIISTGAFNYYSYQRSSHSYYELTKKFKKQRRKILLDYMK